MPSPASHYIKRMGELSMTKDVIDLERDEIEEEMDAIDVMLAGLRMVRRLGLDGLDENELNERLLNLAGELDRRDRADEAAALAEYWREAFI